MTTLKQQAHALIDQLPEHATWQDVAYVLSLIVDIEAGLVESYSALGDDIETMRKHFGLTK